MSAGGYYFSGVGSLGADDVPKTTLLSILNGSMYDDLVSAKAQNNEDFVTIQNYTGDPDPAKRAIAAKAQASNLAARLAIQDAIAKYSQIVGWIQTIVGKDYSPPQLSGLGFFGVDDAAYVLAALAAAGVGIAAALYALSYAYNTFTGKQQETKGYLDQLGGLLDSFAGLIKYATIAAVVGTAIYFGAKIYKTRSAA